MKISKTNGTFWNEDTNCFGPECAATEYDSLDDVPPYIEDNGKELEAFFSLANEVFYYPLDDDNADAVASASEKEQR